jgi:methylenetetrahydrofolate reductase (NADPH)
MDTAIVRRYAARLAEAGLSGRVFLLVGVNPLRSAKSAAWMRQHLLGTIISETMVARLEQAKDAAAEGRTICVETIEELSRIPGVAGAHIMAPGNAAAIPEVIAAARRSVTMAANVG